MQEKMNVERQISFIYMKYNALMGRNGLIQR